MKSIYSTPKVVKYDDLSKPWFVYFRYNKKLFRYKFGINYINNYKERLEEANALRDALSIKLKEGWNPTLPEIESQNSKLTLSEALDFALSKKKSLVGPKTYSGYKGSIAFIKEAIVSLNLKNLLIAETKRVHVKTILEKVREQRSATNKSYNKYLDHFRAVLGELIQWDIIEFNPANKINNMPVGEVQANVPPTEKQHKIIKTYLEENHNYFYKFIVTLFHTGIRPEEILKIQLKMVNMENGEIILPPEITKTDKERVVPINQYFYKMLLSMEFENLPDHYYLFGSFRQSGKGNVGGKLDFIPGPTKMKRDTATKRWKKIVKDGLGIQVNMYSYKKAGADAKIIAGMDLDSLRELYGHSSKMMTLKYITVIKQIHRKQILEHSPDF